jgi:hypothetical protein
MAEVAEPRELVHGNESRSLVGTDGSVAGWGLVAQGCESTRTNEARTMTEDDDLPAHYRVRDPHIFLNRAKRIAPHRGKFRHLGRAKEQRERLSAEEARRELREQLFGLREDFDEGVSTAITPHDANSQEQAMSLALMKSPWPARSSLIPRSSARNWTTELGDVPPASDWQIPRAIWSSRSRSVGMPAMW